MRVVSSTVATKMMIALLSGMLATVLNAGCASGVVTAPVVAATTPPASILPAAAISVTPGTATGYVGDQLMFSVTATPASAASACSWVASNQAVVATEGDGVFLASELGTATVTATCAGATASASVAIASRPYAAPITITKGGTYSGRWRSTDPNVAAVMILTDDPVVLQDSVVTGPGNLIVANGGPKGIHLTVTDVLGIGVNPTTAGLARGNFLNVTGGTSVDVTHATMQSVNAGVVVINSTPTHLAITNNRAIDVEDRESDGKGGLLAARPRLGHTVILTNVLAAGGAEIAWNQMINTPGSSSVEDMISMYDSRGSASAPIAIHDNYLQGAVSALDTGYSGGGILTDGQATDVGTTTAYIDIHDNQVVATENYGIGIAMGHDVRVHNNRVVSSGKTSAGAWMGVPGGNGAAFYLWNFYNSPNFFNNALDSNVGGLVRQDGNGAAVRADYLLTSLSTGAANVSTNNASLGVAGSVSSPSLADEAAELAAWVAKLAAQGQSVGSAAAVQP